MLNKKIFFILLLNVFVACQKKKGARLSDEAYSPPTVEVSDFNPDEVDFGDLKKYSLLQLGIICKKQHELNQATVLNTKIMDALNIKMCKKTNEIRKSCRSNTRIKSLLQEEGEVDISYLFRPDSQFSSLRLSHQFYLLPDLLLLKFLLLQELLKL